jgi:tryptophan 2,3-dioxygenase
VITYWDYLKVYDLLALQHGCEPAGQDVSPDELHFIVVHQVFELWFKLILSEVRRARERLLVEGQPAEILPPVLDSLHRVNRTLTVAVHQWDVMETMSPQDFLLFRDKLFPASGFQSFQFPEIEIVLGLEETLMRTTGEARSLSHIEHAAAQSESGASAWDIVCRARAERTFRDALYRWLAERSLLVQGIGGDIDATVDRFGDAYLEATKAYLDQQVDQLLRDPEASRPVVESRFADNYRLAERFVRAADVAEPHRARYRRLRASLLYIETYYDVPELALERRLIDAVLDLESLLVLWRTRHARAAEKMIGRRVGTGGASVDYLDRSLTLRVFPDLWESRTQVVPRRLAPGHPWTSLATRPPAGS